MSKDNGGPASDKIQQARRAAFEKWFMTTRAPHAPEDLWLRRDEFGHYFVNQVFAAWEGFNAALDGVEIQFPELIGLNESFQGTPISEMRAQNHFNGAVMQCRTAIESTNLGLRAK